MTQPTQPGKSSLLVPFSFNSPHPFAYDYGNLEATQLVIDPRRHGESNSAFSYEDQSDIFCILLPQSTPAHKAVALIQEETPQHTVNFQRDVKIRQKAEGPHQEHKDSELDTGHVYPQGSGAIALRLSSNVKNPSLGGFLFGRNRARCDLVLGQYDEVKRVSNIHFRIYINEYGVIMIEDQSTNGTVVDGTLLRAKDKENQGFRLTIDQSSIIVLTMTPPEEDFRFFVQFPRRDDEAETRYQNNLTNYFHRQAQAQADRRARVGYGIAREPPNIFAAPDVGTPNQSVSYVGRHIREWKGGPKYNKIGTIGKGAFAVVYKLTAKYDGVPFAAKELEKRRFMKNGVLDQKVDMEMQIMRKIKHENIVQYIEHIDWEEYLYIIMEFVPGGDLGSLITKTGRLQEREASEMAAQLLSALKYLHEMNITHRDVKPDNILIQHRSPLQVKLTDFGLSKMVDSEETFLRTFCGTLLYCAPEVYSEYREYDSSGKRVPRGVDKKSLPPQRYGHAVDIWSLAGVLFYALCGTPPYPAKNGTTYQELLNYIMTQHLDIRPLQQANISERGIRFVRSMLHTRPEHRATIEELEGSNWLTGESSLEMSLDEMDEVDLVGNFVEPRLEEGASQLSLQDPEEDPDDREIGDSEENLSVLTELQQPEIPSSFDTSENSMGSESYGFMSNAQNPTGNDRLFGEVGVSALGSSGAIPSEHLPRPEVNTNFPAHSFSRSSLYASNEFSESFLQENYSQYPVTAPIHPTDRNQPQHTTQADRKTAWGEGERATRSSSLMGAESMVGHLNMHSPSSATSPAADRDISTERATEVPDIGVSLRRQREEEGSESSEASRPSDFPSKKRRKSSRMMDLPVPKSIFWDPKDRTTRHDDYPTMSMSDFNAFHDHASEKGERFVHGEEIFDTTLRSFRASRSPSLDLETTTRAQSEPTKEEGRRMMMKRDDRKFADDDVNGVEPRPFLSKDAAMPATARGSHEPESSASENGNATNIPSSGVQPVVGNDFQPPKRILGKIIATSDSCLPTITLNVTETITSWGRGFKNTMRYSNGQDIRVPKYAFKIFLFKPNFYTAAGNLPTNATPGNGKNSTDQDMAFYISNKASSGIFINGINLPSHDRQNPYTASKFWGELRTGDIVTVWQDDTDKKKCVRFRFECYWGLSKEPRKEGEQFRIVPEGDFLNTIERACLSQEKNMMADIERREQEERVMLAEHKRAERARREAAGSTNAPVSLKLFRPPGTESTFNYDKPKPKST